MDKQTGLRGTNQGQQPEKQPVILPPIDPEEVIQPAEDPEYIIPDDEDDTTPGYEPPVPGEGP